MTDLVGATNSTAVARQVGTLVRAFAADPAVRWMYPDPEQYQMCFPEFVHAFGGRAFECGTADELPGLAGVALWLPPDVQPDETAVVGALQRSVSEQRLPELFELFAKMGAFRPGEAHWYLPLIGVDPVAQGRGCGSELMRGALTRCDRDRLPAYLEATNPRNASFYERFGFRRVGTIQSGSSPEIIPMLRPAR